MYINNKHKKIIEDRNYIYIGSYKWKEITIDRKVNNINTYIRVKCPYCGAEYDIIFQAFKNGSDCTHCCNKYENSFAYHIEQELGEPLDKYWDWNKNIVNPYHISKCINKKVWIKCTEVDYHESYEISCSHFVNNQRCPYCSHAHGKKIHPKDSFAQYHIDHTDKDFLTKYWSDKNTIDPFTISPHSHKKIWIKCVNKDYHNDYLVDCHKYTSSPVCPLCSCTGGKTHPKDSFGSLYPEYAKLWSKRNKVSPYEVTVGSGKKYWFVCEICGEEFETSIRTITRNNRSMKCLDCTSSKGEQKINKWLTENNIEFIPQKEFEGLVGLGNGNLSYDFYLPNNNLLIEYQGEFHDGTAGQQTKEGFECQQEHDKRKFNYAKNHNINFLEIWYYDYDNIEDILQQTLIS